MNEKIKGMIAGSLATLVLTGGLTLAKTGVEKADLNYRDIKLKINGVDITPKDATGKVVSPLL